MAISRRHICRLMRNLERRWRITCRYRSRHINGNFRTLKMADGRHFENSFIFISQPWIIRFRSNLVFGCGYLHHEDTRQNFANSRWRMDDILKIVFRLYLGAILADVCERWIAESHANRGHVTKTSNFENSRWRTAAILKIALSPFSQLWVIRFRSHLVGWCRFPFRGWTFNTKLKFYKFEMADGRHIKNRFWLYLGLIYWPIKAKFGAEMKNHMQI